MSGSRAQGEPGAGRRPTPRAAGARGTVEPASDCTGTLGAIPSAAAAPGGEAVRAPGGGTGPGRSASGKRSASGTRSALLAAARQRFGKYGYDGTSIRDIARDAGVDAALVYRYFGSKEALFDAVSSRTAMFEPLLETPLDEVAAWVCDFVTSGPPDEEIPHPVLAVLRSPSREEGLRRFRDEVAQVFSDRFAQRLDGPDAEVRAELVAAWMLGTSLMRRAFRTPALSVASEATLHQHLTAGLGPLLDDGAGPGPAGDACGCRKCGCAVCD
ncbi:MULTISPECIES: TetR/AcrR family transcriptional regulator [Streptomyces]|nr:TetR/AcrR family transcriptional regulator [Streptomyces ruber]